MFDETRKYKKQSHFFFTSGGNLKKASDKVPDKPGVFYVVRLARGNIDLVYIGKSEISYKEGEIKNQLLNGRINIKADGSNRQDDFEKKMKKDNIDGLDIYWFVTMDTQNNDLPDLVHGILLQRHFEVYGDLPPWNKEM